MNRIKMCLFILHTVRLRLLKRNGYICCDIRNVADWINTPMSYKAMKYLHDWTAVMLDGSSTLTTWLYNNNGGSDFFEEKHNMSDEDFTNKARLTRIAWVEWMIIELEKEA